MAYFVTAYNKRNAYQKIAESLLSRVILKKVVQPGLAPTCYLSGYHFFFDRDEILEEILPCISGEEEDRVQIADKLIVDIRDKAESRDLVCECVDLLVATRKGELEARKYGTKYMISKDDIKWFLLQQKLERHERQF